VSMVLVMVTAEASLFVKAASILSSSSRPRLCWKFRSQSFKPLVQSLSVMPISLPTAPAIIIAGGSFIAKWLMIRQRLASCEPAVAVAGVGLVVVRQYVQLQMATQAA